MSRPVMVQLITRLIVGGAQLSALALAEAMSADYDVTIASGPQTGTEGSLLDRAATIAPLIIVPALRREISPRHDVSAVRSLRRIFVRLSPDIIHTHSSKAGIVGRMALPRGSRAAVVHTVHGWGHTPQDAPHRRRAFVAMERLAARRCDVLVAVSDDVRREGLELRIGRPDQYVTIPELVGYRASHDNFDRARAAARARLGVPANAKVLGWVGRFVDQKDPTTLADALAEALRRRPDAWAVLVGDGPLRQHVRMRLTQAGVADRVVFAGLQVDARSLLCAFDVVLHPSRWEGQPRVVQEAVAERVPVIATRVSGALDAIVPGATGFSVPPQDAPKMADLALRALDDPSLAPPLADHVVRAVADRYGAERAIGQYERLFAALASTRRAAE